MENTSILCAVILDMKHEALLVEDRTTFPGFPPNSCKFESSEDDIMDPDDAIYGYPHVRPAMRQNHCSMDTKLVIVPPGCMNRELKQRNSEHKWPLRRVNSQLISNVCTDVLSVEKDVGWDNDLVNESYPWVEKQVVHWPKLGPWQAAVRDGLLQAGVDPFNGFTYDHLYGTKVGGTIFDDNGFRSIAADLLSSSNPKIFRFLLHATTQKNVFDKQ